MSDLKTRVISAVVATILFVMIMISPNIVFKVAFVLLATGMVFEVVRAFSFSRLLKTLCLISAIILSSLTIVADKYLLLGLFLFVIVILFCVLSDPEKYNINELMTATFTLLYVCIFTSFMPRILTLEGYGKLTLLFVFICAWLSDIGAYFTGRFFGKHKLIPKVSPKKTVEGAIGGIVSAVLFSLVYALCLNKFWQIDVHYLSIAIFAIFASILGQAGDLLASMIKRYCGIKDFGKIMPGHGGLLDRCDSIVLIAPLLYYYICIFGSLLA
jgi:CDP-diglyceride synthetase